MASAKVEAKKVDDVLQVTVTGYVGENAGLFNLNFAGVKKMTMDLSGVNYMNSIGVKNWIHWAGQFPKTLQIEFHSCPTLIVNQVNMVAGFLPNNGTIESLLAPYACENCSREETIPLKRSVDYEYASMTAGYNFKPPSIACAKCKSAMELDAIESKFFNFLKSIR